MLELLLFFFQNGKITLSSFVIYIYTDFPAPFGTVKLERLCGHDFLFPFQEISITLKYHLHDEGKA